MAHLKTGRIIPAATLLEVLIRFLEAIAVVMVIVAVILILSGCGKPKPDVQRQQAEFMRRQAAGTNRGMQAMWAAQGGKREPVLAPAPQPVKIPQVQTALRGK